MKIKTKPEDIFKEYEKGKDFKTSIDLYENVEKNQRFFIGDQWKGVNAPGLMKPVFNMIKRVVTFFIAMIVSDDIGVNLESFFEDEENELTTKIISKEIEKIIEKTKLKTKTRTSIKNCAVDGDTAMYVSFNPDIETGQDAQGDLELEIIDNTNIYFGNPYSSDIQKQPYLIVSQRLYLDQVKEYAKENGVSESDIDNIIANNESESNYYDVQEDGLVTVLTKFWKVKNTIEVPSKIQGYTQKKNITEVHYIKVVRDIVIKEETNLECSLYPIAYMTWEPRKRSYHGQSPITGLIPNQIYVNKLFAMSMLFTQNMGFPKIFYDSQRIAEYTNDVGSAIKVQNMDALGRVMDGFKPPDFSNQVLALIDKTIDYTRDMMGASDASLGNVNPNNTSAIIAVQQSSNMPLELQRLAYFDYVEDIVRIIIDQVASNYGVRKCQVPGEIAELYNLYETQIDEITGQPLESKLITVANLDFSQLKNMNIDLNIDIGASTFWSETAQIQTMDSLFNKGILKDPIQYLEGIPDKYIKNKSKIIENVKAEIQKQEELQKQMLNQQMEQENLVT